MAEWGLENQINVVGLVAAEAEPTGSGTVGEEDVGCVLHGCVALAIEFLEYVL